MLLLLSHGANVHQRAADGSTALTAALAAGQTAALQLLLAHGAGSKDTEWMGMDALDVAETAAGLRGRGRSTIVQMLRAYESHFAGNILPTEGCACVVSWPGKYAKLW